MKILQLISSSGCYGAENVLLNLVGIDSQSRAQNLLATFHNRHNPNLELYQRARERGISAEEIVCRGRADWRALMQLRRLLRAESIDIVHTHGYKADLYGYLAARLEAKPVIATCHNWLDHGAKLTAYNRLDRFVLQSFDAVAAVSEPIARQLVASGVPAGRIAVVANGIDIRAFDPRTRKSALPESKDLVIGAVSRLELQKGFEHLLNAFPTVRQSFPSARLLIVGEGPDRGRIEELIKQRGLHNAVTLAGQQTDMPTVYASMDLFVLPSLNEGLPMTLLEAMAASKPIIATRVGAIPKVISHRTTGLLVEPADSVGLASAITLLLSDRSLRLQQAQNARSHVERCYSAEAMAQSYHAMYTNVLLRKHKSTQTSAHPVPPPAVPSLSPNPAPNFGNNGAPASK